MFFNNEIHLRLVLTFHTSSSAKRQNMNRVRTVNLRAKNEIRRSVDLAYVIKMQATESK